VSAHAHFEIFKKEDVESMKRSFDDDNDDDDDDDDDGAAFI